MNILCKLFGHKPLTSSGWMRGVGYAKVLSYSVVDGLNTKHLFLEAKCPRCNEDYRICNVHLPKESA